MKKCLNCKSSNKPESIYCIECGVDLMFFYFCKNCGTQYDQSISFCPHDGGSVVKKKVSESLQLDLKNFKSTTQLVKFLKGSYLITFLFPFLLVIISASITMSSLGIISIVLLYFVGPIITTCIYFRWLFLSSKNLAALGIKTMKFTPLTTILWHFVPIIGIVMTYRSMKEIWIYSENPINPKIENNKPQLVLDWATLTFLCCTPFGVLAIWFLIYVTIKMTTQISEFQNQSYQRLKGMEAQK